MNDAREPESERSIIIERDFAVPPEALFRAFTAPEHLKAWFGPPGYPLTLCEIDFTVGGRFRFGMTGPDGQALPVFGGEYLVIAPPHQLKYVQRFEQGDAEWMEVTFTFEAIGDKTRLTQRTVFASTRMKRAHEQRGYVGGVQAGFDQLATLVRKWVLS